ncbi:MAG TPA: hypothetical protein VKA60_18765 [Blastocatellia bacterium]|nr:hypothetical protein [Blastocatellia bacterium]
MATTLQKDDILKAAQAMTKQERLKLIAEIAALPDEATGVADNPDDEVMKTARQIMDRYSNLLRRLAE